MDEARRQSFLAQKLMIFTEVVFWSAFGLQAMKSRLGETDEKAFSVWSPAVLERIAGDWRRIVEAQGVPAHRLAAVGLSSLPIESMFRSSQQAGMMVNFLTYLVLINGGMVPVNAGHSEEFARLFSLMGGQDFGTREAAEALLEAPFGCFLQVGANDGGSPDDKAFARIYASPHWRKVLMEPVPAAVEALRVRIRDLPAVTVIDAAMSDMTGTRALTVFPSSRQSTFDPRLAGQERDGARGTAVDVRCIDGATLFAEAGIDAVDVLICDTEGHDRIVLEQVLGLTEPGVIVLEFGHLEPADQIAVIELLERREYRWCWQPVSLDIFAVRR
jgi:FkbM family methyltransferase